MIKSLPALLLILNLAGNAVAALPIPVGHPITPVRAQTVATSPTISGWRNDKALGDHLNGPAVNLLANSGFETGGKTLGNWAYILHDGAEGTVGWDAGKSRSGGRALKITKTNSAGYIEVFSTSPLQFAPGANLAAEGYYYTEDVYPDYSAGFLRFDYGSGLAFNRSRCNGGPQELRLINSDGKLWNKRYCFTYRMPEKATRARLSIVAVGNPHTIWWDDLCVEERKTADQRFKQELNKRPATALPSPITPEQLRQRLTADRDHEAWLEKRNGIPELSVDGQTAIPAFYKGPYKTDGKTTSAGLFAQAGQRLGVTSIDFGTELWQGKDSYDVRPAVAKIAAAMREAPEMLFVVTLVMTPYRQFGTDYPDEVWRNEAGKKGSGHSIHLNDWGDQLKKKNFFWPSYFSPVYQAGIRQGMIHLIAALKAQGYMKRIIGFHIAGGHDAQFALRRMDYSAPAVATFQRWLKEKYGTPTALSRAWGKPVTSFEAVRPPPFPAPGIFYNPVTDQAFVDFHRFEKEEIFDLQDRFAADLKKLCGKRIVTLHWCMEPYSGVMHGAHYLDRFLVSTHMDILVAQQSYDNRLIGIPYAFRLPLAAFPAANKLMLSEIDIRTFASGAGMYRGNVFDPGFRTRAESFAVWQGALRRMAGEMIARNQGYWFFEIANTIFADPQLAQDSAEVNALYRRIREKPAYSVNQTAVVYDEETIFWHQLPGMRWHNVMTFNSKDQLSILSYSGVPFDVVTLKYLMDHPDETKKYRLFLFVNACRIDRAKAEFLNREIKRDGNYLVWLYGAANLVANGPTMRSVTGFDATLNTGNPDQFIIPRFGKNLPAQLPLPSITFVLAYSLTLGQKFDNYWGGYYTPPRWEIADSAGQENLSHYRTPGKTALALKKMSGWTSVMAGEAGGIDPVFFHALARRAGAYTTSQPGLNISVNSRFMMINVVRGGAYRITLPRQVRRVVNLYDNRTIASDCNEFHLKTPAQTLYWLLLED